MLGRLFGNSPAVAPPSSPFVQQVRLTPYVDAEGLRFASPLPTSSEWLAMPHLSGDASDLGSRLAQLFTEGFGRRDEQAFVLPWPDVYAVLRDPAFGAQRTALHIPADTELRPRVQSRGAVSDQDFALLMDGWTTPSGVPLRSKPVITGGSLEVDGKIELLPEPMWHLLGQLRQFHAMPPAERTRTSNEQIFGRVRRLATELGCPVSDYVARTIVLTPERMRLSVNRTVAADSSVVEVIPGFDEAPARWLERFDALPLQDSYDVPDGASLVRLVLTPQVKQVLAEIKGMRGRRVAGARAEAFVRNPFAVLGETAGEVLDPGQVERALADAVEVERFVPVAQHGDSGQVTSVGLQVVRSRGQDIVNETMWFDAPEQLGKFVDRLHNRMRDGLQCCFWGGHEFELDGDSGVHLAQLLAWLRAWQSPGLWTAEEVFDISHYSPRIESIGVERPIVVPVVAKPSGAGDWFGAPVSGGVRVSDPASGSQTLVPIRFDEVPALQEVVAAAERAGRPSVHLPGLMQAVPLADARDALEALVLAAAQLAAKSFNPGTKGEKADDPKRRRLVLRTNADEVDYSEDRATALQPPPDLRPDLPRALRPEVALKPHQHEGIAWLQHLWAQSPHRCRGTVLADDMGLGKTLQLLAFMVRCFEADPGLPPALVVAPVALLDNWRMELEKFFQPGALPLLTLYGDNLKALRVPKQQLDEALRAEGVTRLLVKNWVGGARLVLTTYETMRDLEFTMAAQEWSIMVCDEAQKIKTPSTMVTRSAKKQKVRFRVACTGTPVENSLTDLWCLFDFVQPGMLGALNNFSRTYRQPIEAKTDEQRAKVEELRAVIQPQILHRKKTDVVKDLPVPTEDGPCKSLPMSGLQVTLYRSALKALQAQRDTNPSAQLQTLMSLRQICSDPHAQQGGNTRDVEVTRLVNESPKMGWMVDRLKALAARPEEQHKVIIFCEFRELQLSLQRVIATFFGFAPHIVNGDTSADPKAVVNRQRLIDDFQRKPGFGAIVLSPLAVGFGVNIQAANHVIHFTRTWNPAKEDQATARAYRIGQTRTVNVYYPSVVSPDGPSFDQKLDELLERKRSLAADMLNGCGDLTVADFAGLI